MSLSQDFMLPIFQVVERLEIVKQQSWFLEKTSHARGSIGLITDYEMHSCFSMLSGNKKRKTDSVSDVLAVAEKDIEGNFEVLDHIWTHNLTKLIGFKKEIEMPWLVLSCLEAKADEVMWLSFKQQRLRMDFKNKLKLIYAKDGKNKQQPNKRPRLDLTNGRDFSLLLEDKLKNANAFFIGKEEDYIFRCRFLHARPWMTTDVCGRLSYLEKLSFDISNLETLSYDKAKYRKEYKIFHGLEEAYAWGEIPDYLESIANQIEKARGKATEVFHIPVHDMLGAAIKEMEDLPVENLDWDTLEKWGAMLKYLEKLSFDISNLESLSYDKAKYRMEYKIFQGLEEALKNTAWGEIPDYLESITNRIEQARGKATEVFHIPVHVLLCAAIKEMEDLPVENLDWDTLEKWGATLKYARDFGFQVAFADNLLKTNLLAYLAYSTMVG